MKTKSVKYIMSEICLNVFFVDYFTKHIFTFQFYRNLSPQLLFTHMSCQLIGFIQNGYH